MKINFILPIVSMNGGDRVIAIHAKALAERGHDVRLVSVPQSEVPLSRKIRSLVRGRGWPGPPKKLKSFYDAIELPHNIIERSRPIVDSDVEDGDIVVATWWETAEWVHALSPSKGKKAHFIQHHEVFDYVPVDRVKAVLRSPSLAKITISKWLMDVLVDEYGIKERWLVPNSVDTEQFFAPPREKGDPPTVGVLYSPVPWKGVARSFRVIERVRERFPDLRIMTFGVEPPADFLPLPRDTTFHRNPPQSEIRNLYAACDVWLCGSDSEGFGLPVLEAMACRCPVVSSAVGGPLDIVREGHNGYLAPIGDEETLVRGLLRVLQLEPDRWRAMSDAAYETAVSYTWDDATELLERALTEIVSKPIGR